jgi:flagellar hook protein FlgE
MSSGFSIGLSGLQSNSAAIETASKNIASSNVVGFKSTEFLFSEALARSMSGSSGGNFAPAGTGALTRAVFAGGATRYSASPLDLSINGEGMFALTLMQDGSSERVYTRNGQFLTDKDGFIVNANGLYLLGFVEDSGVIDQSKARPLKTPISPVSANTTTTANISVNLDARKAAVDTTVAEGEEPMPAINIKDPGSYSHSTFLTIYDKVGKQHTLALYYQKQNGVPGEGEGAPRSVTYNVYATIDGQAFIGGETPLDGGTAAGMGEGSSVSVPLPDALVAATDTAADGPFVATESFDAFGNLINPKLLTTLTFEAGTLKMVGATEVKSASNASINISLTPPAGIPFDPTVALDDPLSFDFSFFGTSNFASAFEVKEIDQDGYAAGSLTGLSIDETGMLRGQYSNGRSVIAGQIMLSSFPALQGLKEVSPSIYRATDGAGIARVGTPGASVFGTIRSQSLEEANTDMAQELVKLMVQQRNYQANAQSIRAQDELLTTTIQMSR